MPRISIELGTFTHACWTPNPPACSTLRAWSSSGWEAPVCCSRKGAPRAMIYLQVDDVRARVETLRAGGVEIIAEPHVIFSHTDDTLGPAGTDEWMAFFNDSEGNPVGLVSHQPKQD